MKISTMWMMMVLMTMVFAIIVYLTQKKEHQ